MKLPFAKDAMIYIAVTLVLTVILFLIYSPLFFLGLLSTFFILFFFRDPERRIPGNPEYVLSPADGKVMSVTTIYEDKFIKAEARKITIFLSLMNVHINRSPIKGKVVFTEYREGKFLPAFKSHASEINEKNTIGIEGNGIRLVVSQITGFIARRIVCYVKKDDALDMGERFGLIKFGSCTEIIVPMNVEVKVKAGDRVKGASTILGVIR